MGDVIGDITTLRRLFAPSPRPKPAATAWW